MILKGSQRSGGQNLAAHLMKMEDNEHVRVHEVRGFCSDTLHGAFKEAEAISRATRCSQYLFSLSLNPPEGANVAEEIFERALDRIEDTLGLQGQPRAVVFHEKDGRRHAHCVWSRIDAASLTARPLPFFKRKLMDVSRDLYLEHGWKMPRGFENAAERDPTNFTLAEWQQAKRQGIDPRWLKQTVQNCWKGSDTAHAFVANLAHYGFALAKGGKKSDDPTHQSDEEKAQKSERSPRQPFVIVDHTGNLYALTRTLGLRKKELSARLGDGADLPSVDGVKKQIGARMTPAIRRHIEESRNQFRQRSATLGHYKMEMTHLHREARAKLDQRQRTEWDAETCERGARLPHGIRGFWHKITGR